MRVLNLWQKNGVFPMEVVQPLLDLAADPNNVELVLTGKLVKQRIVFRMLYTSMQLRFCHLGQI